MPSLVITAGENSGAQFELATNPIVLGRSTDADVQVSSTFVSGRHAEISELNGRHTIRDLGSRNGTFCNGRRLDSNPFLIKHGDVIELAQDVVRLEYVDEPRTVTQIYVPEKKAFVVDRAARELFLGLVPLAPAMPRRLFDIVALLYENEGKLCTFHSIARIGWPHRQPQDVTDNEIHVAVRIVRKRLEEFLGGPQLIQNIRGLGYKMVIPPELRE